jgi:alpha-glucosidase
MAIGEIHIFDWEEWAKYYGRNLDEFHLPFNFALLNTEWKARAIRKVVDELEAILPPGAWPNYVLANHDESRIATRCGPEQARIAAMLLLTLRGTPTLYYGDEIGMTDVEIPLSEQQDPFGLQVPGWGRDRCRTPMQWDASHNAGFSSPETRSLWLPLGDNYNTANVKSQLNDPKSMLHLYRRLLAIRKSAKVLQSGSYFPIDGLKSDCFVFLRQSADNRILVALNFSSHPIDVPIQNLGNGKIILSTYMDRLGNIDLESLKLRADEGVIVAL